MLDGEIETVPEAIHQLVLDDGNLVDRLLREGLERLTQLGGRYCLFVHE